MALPLRGCVSRSRTGVGGGGDVHAARGAGDDAGRHGCYGD